MAKKWDAGTITTNGVEVPVQIDDYSGEWHAEYAGQYLRTETRKQMEGKLARLTKKAKVTVEVHVIKIRQSESWTGGDIRVTRGVLTGIHSGTGNVLAAWTVRGQVQKEQVTDWSQVRVDYVGGDTTDEELAEYNLILKELKELQDRKSKWLKRHEIEPKDAVQRAIDAVTGTDEG